MASKPEDVRVRYAVSLIDQHHSDPPTVRDLAKAVNVSPSHLTRLFREHTGRSPKQFGRDVRLERACVLVMTTFMSIKEVMAAVGWNDPSHFSRDFKKHFGASPTELRNGARNSNEP